MKIKIIKDCKWSFNPSMAPSVFVKDQICDLSIDDANKLIEANYAHTILEGKKQDVPENKMLDISSEENKEAKKRGRPKIAKEEK
jgi:hypothetical protein